MNGSYFGWLILLAGIISFSAEGPHAAEVDLQGEVEVAVNSAFVWRGEVINDEAVINPYVALYARGWKLSVWGSWDATSVENRSDHSRVDTMLEYAREWNRQIFSIGSVAYVYHDSDRDANRDTFEAFVGYRIDVLTLPSLTVYYDFGEIEGFYARFAMRHGIPLIENRLSLDVGASLGAGDEDYVAGAFTLSNQAGTGSGGYEPDGAVLIDWNVTIDLPIELGEQFTLMPGFRYMDVVDSDLNAALEADGRASDETVWSLRGTYYF